MGAQGTGVDTLESGALYTTSGDIGDWLGHRGSHEGRRGTQRMRLRIRQHSPWDREKKAVTPAVPWEVSRFEAQ